MTKPVYWQAPVSACSRTLGVPLVKRVVQSLLLSD
jgi:hypothetical protein